MDIILNSISVIGTSLFVFGVLYLIQRFTIGLIPFFKRQLGKWLSIGDVLFCSSSFLFILAFVDFYKPY